MAEPTSNRRLKRFRDGEVLAAIDVGTNAVRLEMSRLLPDGTLEKLHTERDAVRPGEGLFTTGKMSEAVLARLLSTLRRYGAVCRRDNARVRAVATSSVRDARNRDVIVRRVRREAQLTLDVVSGKEEARLICLGVFHGAPPRRRSLLFHIGGGSTEVVYALGENPKGLWSLDLGGVRLTEWFRLSGKVPKKQLKLLRQRALDAVREDLPATLPGRPKVALGSSGTIEAVVNFARAEGFRHATGKQISKAVEQLAQMDEEKRRKRFDNRRADIIVAGAVILEALMEHFGLTSITAVDRGLREGILRDLVRRQKPSANDPSLAEAALALGRRFSFGEKHAIEVSRLALKLFDDLGSLHQLPAHTRSWLEVAALLHDVGHVLNHQRHHKHTYYLVLNADLPGLSDRERLLVATIARFHRRSPPTPNHEAMVGLTPAEVRLVSRAAMLLRIADSLDASHHQPVVSLKAKIARQSVVLALKTRGATDLELWTIAQESELFNEVFGKSLKASLV